jgi:aspartate aminotransferase-like enzyme
MGLKMLVDGSIASNTVTSVFLPTSIDMKDFIKKMENRGFTVYPGKGQLLNKNMFQIANMGQVDERMCCNFLNAMEKTITDMGM